MSEVAQSCPTLCDPMNCSLPYSSIHGIFQARILEWVDISFSRRSSRPMDWTQVSHIVGRHFTCFTVWATSSFVYTIRQCSLQKMDFQLNGLVYQKRNIFLINCLVSKGTFLVCTNSLELSFEPWKQVFSQRKKKTTWQWL